MELDMKNRVVDVSSFFLFEATGDSEAGCHFDPAIAAGSFNRAEDDDAESCSCDTSDFGLPTSVRDRLNGLQKRANVEEEEYEEDGEVVEQQKEVHLFEKWRNNNQRINGVVANEQKSVVSVDSTKSMNEMEKSKLFWEACLAS